MEREMDSECDRVGWAETWATTEKVQVKSFVTVAYAY